MSAKDKLAKAWEWIVLGSGDEQEAADDLRKSQEEDTKKQEGQ